MAVIDLNKETFHHLLQGEKPTLVEFWAPWCRYCVELERTFEEIAMKYGQQLAIGKVNIDDHPALAEKYFIEYVPTLAIFSEGDLIDFVISPDSQEAIAQFIQDSL